MKMKVISGLLLVMALFGGYWYVTTGDSYSAEISSTDEIQSLVNDINAGTAAAHSASIDSHELVVKDDKNEGTHYDLSEEDFFVSIAPYLNETHPCEIHSLTGCEGEMQEEDFYLSVIDMDGSTILEKDIQSLSNGFIDLWLPRDKIFEVTIEHKGKTVKKEISTFEGDNTCITDMQLR
ncbi:CueP family metal-binding protein [Alkalicoccus daliensis]|uniref:CueP family metal-binding protein n=1 Tax=Alkalicoccus daliensis TaxID=745820 RepID=A0A1H0DUI0_9BACI|nr:CueP family metal-binding protein [Alkalicoccus daliensis]SDN73832.1 hypothetical protein SAMN04488053_10392 [Alkalicoccus daliensis]